MRVPECERPMTSRLSRCANQGRGNRKTRFGEKFGTLSVTMANGTTCFLRTVLFSLSGDCLDSSKREHNEIAKSVQGFCHITPTLPGTLGWCSELNELFSPS